MEDEERYELKCEYEGDTDKLREILAEILKTADRIDKLTLKEYEKSTQGAFPNTEITILFYRRKE